MNIYLFEELSKINTTMLNKAVLTLPEWRKKQNDKLSPFKSKVQNACAYYLLKYSLYHENIICDLNEEFKIKHTEKGKPYSESSGVDFSISHCNTGVVCAVSDNQIGIDIEAISKFNIKIAERVCCDDELKMLSEVTDKADLFYKMWTLKEAYSKMTGNGFSEGFHKINTLNTEVNGAFLYSYKGFNVNPYYIGVSCKSIKNEYRIVKVNTHSLFDMQINL